MKSQRLRNFISPEIEIKIWVIFFETLVSPYVPRDGAVGAATCAADRHRLRSPPILPLIEGCCLRGWIVVGLRASTAPPLPSPKKIWHSIHSCTRFVTEVPLRALLFNQGRIQPFNHSIQPRAEARCAVLVTASRWSRSFEVRAGRPVEAV